MKRSAEPFGGTAPYCVQLPSVSRIAGPNSIWPETRSIEKCASVAPLAANDSRCSHVVQVDSPGVWTSSVSPGSSGSTGLMRSGSSCPGVPSLTPSTSAPACAECAAGSSAPIGAAVIE